jgi:hypothetical protein
VIGSSVNVSPAGVPARGDPMACLIASPSGVPPILLPIIDRVNKRIFSVCQFNGTDLPFNFDHLTILQAFVFAAQHFSAPNSYCLFDVVIYVFEAIA